MVEIHKSKVVLLSDGVVGKTSLMKRHLDQTFSDAYIPSIGANFKKRILYYEYPCIDLNMRICDPMDIEDEELKFHLSDLFALSEEYEKKFFFTGVKTGNYMGRAFFDISFLSLNQEPTYLSWAEICVNTVHVNGGCS